MSKWKKNLTPAAVTFMQEIIDQVPVTGGAQAAFTSILDKIGEPDVETQHRLDKLQALENNGVDNWDGYDDAMNELDGEDDDD